MGISVQVYDETPAMTVAWDLQLRKIELKLEQRAQAQAQEQQ